MTPNHGLNDVKHVTAASAADEYSGDPLAPARGVVNGVLLGVLGWALIIAVAVLLFGGGYIAGEDAAIERLEAKERSVRTAQRELGLQIAEGWQDGYAAGRASVVCLGGFRVDSATRKLVDVGGVR